MFALLAHLVLALALVLSPGLALADVGPTPIYSSLDELEGKTFAYVNGSVYYLKVQAVIPNTEEAFYPSIADCVAAVRAGKADAAVQLSFGLQLVENRSDGELALVPGDIAEVEECFFFSHGNPLRDKVDAQIQKFTDDGTIERLREKWVGADEAAKVLPAQDWDAPNGTLRFATPGVLEPYSYVGNGSEVRGFDVDLALLIARELGYHLDISVVPMDSIFAGVEAGKIDFAGTATATPERAQSVDFSMKVMPDHVAAIVRADTSAAVALDAGAVPEYTTVEELAGKTIATQTGSTLGDLLVDMTGVDVNFNYYNQVADEIEAVKGGKVDAFVEDGPVCRLAVAQNPELTILPAEIAQEDFGMMFVKGNPLCDEFSRVIDEFRADGTLDRLEEKWCGANEDEKVLPDGKWDAPKGTLRCATMGTLIPMAYLKDGELAGYDVELAMLIAKELGYGIEFIEGDSSSVLGNVSSGKADFAACGLTINDERKVSYDFTSPTYYGSVTLVVRNVAHDAPVPETGLMARLASSFRRTFIDEDRWLLILQGLCNTIVISVCAGTLGILLGYLCVLARRSEKPWVSKLVDVYQAIMSGVPLVVILMFFYYVVFGALDIPGVLVAIIAFTLSFGSTAGSTMWTAVSSLDGIQEETGMALGFRRQGTFHYIVFPQAASVFMPQLAGQFVGMVKETAIVGYIAVLDLTRASDLIRSRTMDAFFPLLATALIYFVFCRLLAWALGKLVKRFDQGQRPQTVEGVDL